MPYPARGLRRDVPYAGSSGMILREKWWIDPFALVEPLFRKNQHVFVQILKWGFLLTSMNPMHMTARPFALDPNDLSRMRYPMRLAK